MDPLVTGLAMGVVLLIMSVCLGFCIIGVSSRTASYHLNTTAEINIAQGYEYAKNVHRSNKVHVQNLYEKKYPNAVKVTKDKDGNVVKK